MYGVLIWFMFFYLGEIDVILQIQDDSTRACLESYLTAQMERVNVNFLQGGNTPTHPWVFVCDTFDEDKFLKLKDDSKGNPNDFNITLINYVDLSNYGR